MLGSDRVYWPLTLCHKEMPKRCPISTPKDDVVSLSCSSPGLLASAGRGSKGGKGGGGYSGHDLGHRRVALISHHHRYSSSRCVNQPQKQGRGSSVMGSPWIFSAVIESLQLMVMVCCCACLFLTPVTLHPARIHPALWKENCSRSPEWGIRLCGKICAPHNSKQ